MRLDFRPQQLGLPYEEWRNGQWEVIERAYGSRAKFVYISAPTGRGKSGMGVGLAGLEHMAGRSCVLATKTLHLQDQYVRDFPTLGLLKGRSNYRCVEGHPNAALAPCAYGGPCDLKGTDDCDLYRARNKAAYSDTIITNYDLALTSMSTWEYESSPFQGRNVLICDEGHLLDESIRSAAGAHFTFDQLESLAGETGIDYPLGNDLEEWQDWCELIVKEGGAWVRLIAKNATASTFADKSTRNIVEGWRLANNVNVARITGTEMVVKKGREADVEIAPIFASHFFKGLVADMEKVYILSATLPSAALLSKMLGVSPEEQEYIQLDSDFPVDNRPLIIDPIMRVSRYKMTADAKADYIAGIDEWLDQYEGKKGIIHCHSYWLKQEFMEHSRHVNRFITHNARGLGKAIEEFERNNDGAILLSPTAHSGVDLPYDHVRFQIIGALPFPDLSDPVIVARKEAIPQSYDYIVASTVLQAYGRGNRANDDYCETVIPDANWTWWYKRNWRLIPDYVRAAIREI